MARGGRLRPAHSTRLRAPSSIRGGVGRIALLAARRDRLRRDPDAAPVRLLAQLLQQRDRDVPAAGIYAAMVRAHLRPEQFRQRLHHEPAGRRRGDDRRAPPRRAREPGARATPLPGSRGGEYAPRAAAGRSRHRRRHRHLRVPDRNRTRDGIAAPGFARRARARAHHDHDSVDGAPADRQSCRLRSFHRRGRAQSRRLADPGVPEGHASRHQAWRGGGGRCSVSSFPSATWR